MSRIFLTRSSAFILGEDFLLSFGGSFWYRYMRESDARLTTTNDNYHMIRSRFHADFWYQDKVRFSRNSSMRVLLGRRCHPSRPMSITLTC